MLMEPGLLTRDQARELLADHHDKFAEAHREAWATWLRLRKVCHEAEADDLLLGLTPTTRANFVNNHCTKQVRGLIEPSESISFADLGSELRPNEIPRYPDGRRASMHSGIGRTL